MENLFGHMKNKTVVVTGGTGFVGGYLVEYLLRLGARVYVVSRCHSAVEEKWNGLVKALISDILVDDIILPNTCNYIFHCAGVLRGDTNQLNFNVLGTSRLLEAASHLENLKRFIHLSSVGVLGATRPGRYDEYSDCKPINDYEVSKFQAENIVDKFSKKFDIVTLRPTNVFGVYSDPELDLFIKLLRAIKSRRFRLIGRGLSPYNLVYVEDVAMALVRLAVTDRSLVVGKKYIINDPVRWAECYQILSASLGVRTELGLPKWLAYPASHAGDLLNRLGIDFPLTSIRYRALTYEIHFSAKSLINDTGFKARIGTKAGLLKLAHSYKDYL